MRGEEGYEGGKRDAGRGERESMRTLGLLFLTGTNFSGFGNSGFSGY